MKKLLLMLSICAGGLLQAQPSNAPAAKKEVDQKIEVNSDSADFDLNIRRATYHGHVVVLHPQVTLTCESLVLDLPEHAARVNHILAETNVVVDFTDDKSGKYHITSDKAIYVYNVVNTVTNETVTFTGHARAETTNSVITAEPMVWDRADGHLHFTNPHMESRQNTSSHSTNGSPVKIF
jgi:lipopolysaccharide transport protein LptA